MQQPINKRPTPNLRPRSLIQDILPPGGKRDRTLRVATETAKRVHQATQLSNIPQSQVVRRVQGFDMLAPRGPQRPAGHKPASKVASKPAKTKPARHGFWRRLGEFAQYPLIAALAIGCAYSSTVGQLAVGLFFVVALILRLSSRFSFGAALLLLASIPAFQAINQTGVAQKAAIYAYELLVVGTLQAILELVLSSRKQTTPSSG